MTTSSSPASPAPTMRAPACGPSCAATSGEPEAAKRSMSSPTKASSSSKSSRGSNSEPSMTTTKSTSEEQWNCPVALQGASWQVSKATSPSEQPGLALPLLRCLPRWPPPQALVQGPHGPQSPRAQLSAQGSAPQTSTASNNPQGTALAPVLLRRTLRWRARRPPPQLAEQAPHSAHAPIWQSCEQGSLLQGTVKWRSGHGAPSALGTCITSRVRLRTPPPHKTVHALSRQGVTSQSITSAASRPEARRRSLRRDRKASTLASAMAASASHSARRCRRLSVSASLSRAVRTRCASAAAWRGIKVCKRLSASTWAARLTASSC
mmetsp:Transcript_90467/g.194038  ORF Transcript_90467/g.194038 Transcript_90467/m.194038 type:complete len:322 (-) Transcript_90467:719-1684(-)